MPETIALVEDDTNLREVLADNLEDEGYRVLRFATASAARVCVETPSLWLLDVMLPDGDGYALCRTLRAAAPAVPIIMLTARTLEQDVIAALDGGADDYIAKPYRLGELLARIRARLRQAPAKPLPSELRAGPLTIDAAAERAYLDGTGELALTKTEYAILGHLVEHAGALCTREALLKTVWGPGTHVDSHTVDNFISSLRRKLGEGVVIATVRGRGFRLDIPAP